MPELSTFALVGGTALALKYGHRKSIDLDLFSPNDFDHAATIAALQKALPHNDYEHITQIRYGVFLFLEEVKVDLIYYPHPLLNPVENRAGIKILSDEDLMAMKVNAVLGRGKQKDFWDIAELLRHYSVSAMIDCYHRKYPQQHLAIPIPNALLYFADADSSEAPVVLNGQTWDDVKQFIRKQVNSFLL